MKTRSAIAWAKRNPSKVALYLRRWRAAHPEEAKAYTKKWREANADRYHAVARALNKRVAARIQAYVKQTKAGKSCTDCGQTFIPQAMEYDHRVPKEKLFIIGRAAAMHCKVERIDAEIAKCDLVCAVCHRYRTFGVKRFPVAVGL